MTHDKKERLAKRIVDEGEDFCASVRAKADLPIGSSVLKGMRAAFQHAARIIREQPTDSPWISVEERLPEDRQEVLAFYDDGEDKHHVVAIYGDKASHRGNHWFTDEDNFSHVTHWMELPPPPDGSA